MKLHKLILMAVMLLLIPVKGRSANPYDFIADNICYKILDADAKTVEVTYYTEAYTNLEGRQIPHNVKSVYSNYPTYYYSGDITIPSTVTNDGKDYTVIAIGDKAFYCCYRITSIEIPGTVTSLGKYSLSVYGKVYTTGSQTEAWLKKVTFAEGSQLKTIGERAFQDCSQLESITIPSGVTSIGDRAFYGCTGLSSIYSYIGEPFPIDKYVFYNVNKTTCTLYVPDGSLDLYKATEKWNEFLNIEVDETTRIIGDLIDAQPYTNVINRPNRNINYIRNFKNTNWQALYIPFEMSYDDWKDNFDVARINNFFYRDNDDDGVNEEAFLNVTKVKSGTLKANYPYLIRAKATGEYTFSVTNATLYKAESKTVTCSSVDYNYTFVGIYETYSDLYVNEEHAMSGGELKQAASASATLSPYRWYLKSEAREPSVIESKIRNIRIHVEGEEETSIATLDYGNKPVEKVYNLNGQFVGSSLDSLAPGVYIKGGKKYVVK